MTKSELAMLADKFAIACKIERDKPVKKGKTNTSTENIIFLNNYIFSKIHVSDKGALGFKDWEKMSPHERLVWSLSKFNDETLYRTETICNNIIEKYKKEVEEKRLADERKAEQAQKEHEKKTTYPTTEQLSFNSYK